MTETVLDELAATIRARRAAPADRSYTRQLLDAGPPRCAKKLGEETVEAIIAALSEDKKTLANEAADVVYHLLVLLESCDVAVAEVLNILKDRMGTSGLAEKAARDKKG